MQAASENMPCEKTILSPQIMCFKMFHEHRFASQQVAIDWDVTMATPVLNQAASSGGGGRRIQAGGTETSPLTPAIQSRVYRSVYLSVCLSVPPSIHLSIYLSIYLYIYLSIYLFIYLQHHDNMTHSLPATQLRTTLGQQHF